MLRGKVGGLMRHLPELATSSFLAAAAAVGELPVDWTQVGEKVTIASAFAVLLYWVLNKLSRQIEAAVSANEKLADAFDRQGEVLRQQGELLKEMLRQMNDRRDKNG